MQTEERIEKLKEYIEKRRRLKLDQRNDSKTDTIHSFDDGDLTKILYTINWVLGDDSSIFLGIEDV